MRKALLLLSAGLFSFIISQSQTIINLGTTNVEWTTLYTTTDLPWELKYGPGDSLWMTTRQGRVIRVHATNGGATQLLDHSASVWVNGEAGMLGMTFHPDFPNTPHVFIAYTYTSGGNNRERLSRFTYSNNTLNSEFVVIDGGAILANSIHNGSRLVILPDNTILMTTGDAANTSLAQNTSSLNGKVLRANLDGTIPANNPNPASYIYSRGHRNAQGLALHPNGKVYETEHGPGNNDEFQIIETNRNYGWPNVEGFCDNDINGGEIAYCNTNNIKEPLASWNVSPGGTWAPNDLVYYTHPAIPEFQNKFLVAFLKTNKVRSVTLNTTGDAVTAQADFFGVEPGFPSGRWGRLRDITTAPNGEIFIATNSSPNRIIRIRSLAPVPVSITDYKAGCANDLITIKWRTQAESQSKQFNLYRSTGTNANDFKLVSVIPTSAPGGMSNIPLSYSYTDNSFTNTSKTFYKLVSEDLNGTVHNFGIVSASCEKEESFILSPNPANSKAELKWGDANPLTIRVYNTVGQLIYQTSGRSPVSLPVNQWTPDVYFITAYDTRNTELFRSKLLVR
ncbi:MAG: PQQ-dependent sugar dehydrogenase [Ferruginibacter sp.]